MIVNFQEIANAGIKNIQFAIDGLNTLKLKPEVTDVVDIEDAIDQLQEAQVSLQDIAFVEVQDDPSTQAAIDALTTASANLNTEVTDIITTRAVVTKAVTIVGYATSLVGALKTFAVL